jgi:hypothetical protein
LHRWDGGSDLAVGCGGTATSPWIDNSLLGEMIRLISVLEFSENKKKF